MIQEIIKAFIFIFIAEMGDKTQILAMAFATRYPVKKVLLGIGIGAFLNHGLAVFLGAYLSKFVPISMIQIVAGLAFIGFALWTLKADNDDDEEEVKFKFGPVATVALAFFIGELGDKTQLTAITLATDATNPFMILTGTVLGMMATGAIGIFVGKKLGDKIPELGIKFMAATVFMIFGLLKLYQSLPSKFLSITYVIPFLLVLFIIVMYLINILLKNRRMGISSELQKQSQKLYLYYKHIEKDLEDICMGTEYCKACDGTNCAIGHAKKIVKSTLSNEELKEEDSILKESYIKKEFEKEKILDSLNDTIEVMEKTEDENELNKMKLIKEQLETILEDKKN